MKWCSSDYSTVGRCFQPPLALCNLLVFSSGAVNESVPDAATHPNKDPSQEGNIAPPVRKSTAPKLITEESFVAWRSIFVLVFTNKTQVLYIFFTCLMASCSLLLQRLIVHSVRYFEQ